MPRTRKRPTPGLLNIARAIFPDNVGHFVFVRVRAFEKVTRDSGVSRFFRRRRYPAIRPSTSKEFRLRKSAGAVFRVMTKRNDRMLSLSLSRARALS